jgi:hypothetical protein
VDLPLGEYRSRRTQQLSNWLTRFVCSMILLPTPIFFLALLESGAGVYTHSRQRSPSTLSSDSLLNCYFTKIPIILTVYDCSRNITYDYSCVYSRRPRKTYHVPCRISSIYSQSPDQYPDLSPSRPSTKSKPLLEV